MTIWDTDALFETLLRDYTRYMNTAQDLKSSNEEDTYEIRLAIVGFSTVQPVEEWGYDYYNFIKDNLDGDLSLKSLSVYGDDAKTYAQFACLCLGAMLGKYANGEIDDDGFFYGNAQLAGFMHLHLAEIG